MLPQKLPHDHGGRVADVQALDLPELGYAQRLDIGVVLPIEAEAVFLMAENKGAARRQTVGMKWPVVSGLQGKESVTTKP